MVVLAALINALHALRAALEPRWSGSAILSAVWHTDDVSQQGQPLVSQAVQPARASIQSKKLLIRQFSSWIVYGKPGSMTDLVLACKW